MTNNLSNHQPVITVQLPGELHHLSIVTVRQLANGAEYLGDKDQLIRLLSAALKDLVDGG